MTSNTLRTKAAGTFAWNRSLIELTKTILGRDQRSGSASFPGTRRRSKPAAYGWPGTPRKRSAKTSTSTVIEVLPTRTTWLKKLRMSPTRTGCLNTNWFTATVAIRPFTMRAGTTEPARSTWAMTQPPKMSPLALQSAGMGMTLRTSSLSEGAMLKGADMGKIP